MQWEMSHFDYPPVGFKGLHEPKTKLRVKVPVSE